jgi:hypothetical protein
MNRGRGVGEVVRSIPSSWLEVYDEEFEGSNIEESEGVVYLDAVETSG